MNCDDYINRMETLISDPAKFQILSVPENKDFNFMVKKNRLVDNILDTLYEKNAITRDIKTTLTPDGPSPARLYGLPKIHKALVDGLPNYRPTISQIGSLTYKIAKFLLDFTSPITKNEYTLKDSFEFVSMIDKQDHNSFMCSFDIDSLFTNVLLEETIEIVIKNVFGRKRKINGLSKSDFRDLLKLTTMGTVFRFNGNCYKQLDGVAMSSLLGPALANAFLCHHERKWLKECPVTHAPTFYKRYVTDIFVLLMSESQVNNLLFYLNSKHKNIRFTCEIEKDRYLAFLDINVYRGNNKFETSVQRKLTFSGVYTNYRSFIATEYKSSLITTLLYGSFTIVSDYHKLHEEIVKLKSVLRQNGSPTGFLDKIISKLLDKSFKKRFTITTVPKKTLRLVLPYLGTQSLSLKKKLNKLFKEQLPSGKLEMSSCFRFKDAIPRSLLSGIIYEYKFPRCNSRYIGSTYRYWEKRLGEHFHMSALTGKPLKGLQSFAPMLHAKGKCCINNSSKDFRIIGREKDRHLIRLKESMFINHFKPSLNTKEDNAELVLFTQ